MRGKGVRNLNRYKVHLKAEDDESMRIAYLYYMKHRGHERDEGIMKH